ncbi:MAG: HNH endonuclease [Bdellovibrionaceae bacterium]|nr:HNH endonuclease [Pseudobdellovibrionaceae bacterium]
MSDNSKYNFKRGEWKNFIKSSRVHNCSAAVLGNVKNQPIKYLCKYFDIKTTEDSLSNIEEVLNAFSAAEQGKMLLLNERNSILDGVKNLVPSLIFSFGKKTLIKKLGFEFIDVTDIYFPSYTFKYISSGGNSSAKYDINLDVQMLEKLVSYLGGLVKFRKSVQGQRALMTTRLRDEIKSRDNFSCQICKISAKDTTNLLLEIDHIMPISRGGITSIENLQTLCWKCNRSKGAKV